MPCQQRQGGERQTSKKSLLEECVRREEIVFSMISGIRLDLNTVISQIRDLDETLVRILRVEEKDLEIFLDVFGAISKL